MTQEQLAQIVGASQPAITTWDNGRRTPTNIHVRRLLEATLGAPIHALMQPENESGSNAKASEPLASTQLARNSLRRKPVSYV
jgi:transcriptional regulator with XRE-family HTH domain